ncbi:unnamed protein product [Closterium sp. NIES-65]|nr:unnamed protein product [Closterium sp. NIES-65]
MGLDPRRLALKVVRAAVAIAPLHAMMAELPPLAETTAGGGGRVDGGGRLGGGGAREQIPPHPQTDPYTGGFPFCGPRTAFRPLPLFPRRHFSISLSRSILACLPFRPAPLSHHYPPSASPRPRDFRCSNRRAVAVLAELKAECGAFPGSATWQSGRECARMAGVTCDKNGNVQKLYVTVLSRRQLTGSLPESLANLTALQHM